MSGFLSVNPVTGETTARYPLSTVQDVEHAMSQARNALDSWSNMPVVQRLERLKALKPLISLNLGMLQEALCAETGKTPQDALGADVLPLIDAISWLQSAAHRHLRDRNIDGQRNVRLICRPAGVAAVIGTWNFPFLTDGSAILWALAAGCTVVWKPSELATASALALSNLFHEAQLPVWLVPGDSSTSSAICDLDPDKVAFTGSVAGGRSVLARLATNGIPAVMELGGNDAMVVLRDADIRAAAKSAVWARVSNAGQTCVAPQRIFVAEQIESAFVHECSLYMSQLKRDRDYGPMRTSQLRSHLHEMVQAAVKAGASAVIGGECPGGSGFYYPPTLLCGCSLEMDIVRQDVFGPVLAVIGFSDEDQVVSCVNATEYGLAASIWSRDAKRAQRIASRLKVGNISINRETQFLAANPGIPFGGTKASGFGKSRGIKGLDEWVVWQPVTVNQKGTAGRHLMPYRPDSADILSAIARWKCASNVLQRMRALQAIGNALRAWRSNPRTDPDGSPQLVNRMESPDSSQSKVQL